ncbi:DUF481 domain-containing protein [Nitrospina watsonii]|nr:DUF481 domain-containing protein [Nitrospina watsonii]
MTFLKIIPRQLLSFALGCVLLAASPAWGGEVHFGDGNALHGTITSFHDGTLTLSTEYSKKVKIPVDQIQTITTEEVVRVELKDGGVLRGRLVTKEDDSMGIELVPMNEVVSLRWDTIKYINKSPRRWSGNFFLGGSVQSGNVELTSISGGFEAERNWENDRLSMRAIHNYSEQDGDITSRNTFGAFKLDHFFTENIYSLISTELLKDEFKNLNLRAIIGAGIGYNLWRNTEKRNLEFEAGLTYFSEDLRVGEDERFLSARIASNFMYKFYENVKFENFFLAYPNVESPSEYRLRNQASVSTTLMGNWSLKLTHIFDYNSNPAEDVKKADQTFIFSLQYNFGN